MGRKPTYSGYMLGYCNRLCGMPKPTRSIRKLFTAVEAGEPEAAEILFLVAFDLGRLPLLIELADGSATRFFDSYRDVYPFCADCGSSLELIEKHGDEIPYEYTRTKKAWKAARGDNSFDDDTKRLIAKIANKRLSPKRGERMAICRKLGLNPGNMYAFLRGDVSKLSLEKARLLKEEIDARAGVS